MDSCQSSINYRKSPKTLIYLVIVAIFFDIFVQIPVISPYALVLGASLFMAGFIVAAYSISNMFGNFLAGPVIDRQGRKRSIVFGTFAAGIVVSLYSLAETPAAFTFFRILHGLAIAFVTPAAFTYLGDQSDSENRGKAMAKSGIAISLPALVGPPLGGYISSQFGYSYVFYLDALILITVGLASLFLLKESLKPQDAVPPNLWPLIKTRSLQVAYLAAFSLMFAKGTLMYMLPLHVENLGYSPMETGILLGTFALAAIILFMLPVNMADRMGRVPPLLLGLLLVSLSVGSLTFLDKVVPLAVAMFVYGLGFGLLFPAMTALLVDSTCPENRGAAFGIFYGLFSGGVIAGPISAGYLLKFDLPPFLLASTIVLIFIAVISVLLRKH